MTAKSRIPFGLERLPRTMALDDPRLPCAVLDGGKLRLNSDPVPSDIMPSEIGDHTARVTAAVAWLAEQCGDYAKLRRQFIARYFEFIARHLQANHSELVERLRPFDDLYAPEDWTWSALRPLPRAWLQADGQILAADVAFYDGARLIAFELATRDTERQAALQGAGITVNRIEPSLLSDAGTQLNAVLPDSFRYFWRDETLPSSPFRRPIPAGVILATG